MESNAIRWKKLDELPMDKPMIKKVLLLTEGRFNKSHQLHVVTDYWHVCHDKMDCDWKLFSKKERVGDLFAYGKMEEGKVPMSKVVAWMWADSLISIYANPHKTCME